MRNTAIDSSVLVAYLNGDEEKDTDYLRSLLAREQAYLPPVTISEILSYPRLTHSQSKKLSLFPLLEIHEGYWQRAGRMRASLLAKGLKAHLPDALIAQSCIDHNVPLLTRDQDFRHYAEHCGLRLALPLDNSVH